MSNGFLSPVLFVLVTVLIVLSVVALFYLYISARNRERLALIEKGMDPNLARSDFWLQVGIIAGGIAAGLMVDDLMHLGYGPLMGIFVAGAALVAYHMIRRSKLRRRNRV